MKRNWNIFFLKKGNGIDLRTIWDSSKALICSYFIQHNSEPKKKCQEKRSYFGCIKDKEKNCHRKQVFLQSKLLQWQLSMLTVL